MYSSSRSACQSRGPLKWHNMNRELNQINVIPLVDVMLVLLVIVLTTATFIHAGQIQSIWRRLRQLTSGKIPLSSLPSRHRVGCS